MNERDFKLAVKAGWIKEAGEPDAGCLNLEQFADLIRADEREACAKVCEQPVDEIQITDDCSEMRYMDGKECAEAIRARGNT